MRSKVIHKVASAVQLTGVFVMAAFFAVASLACMSVTLVFFLGVVLQYADGFVSVVLSYLGSLAGAVYCGAIALRIAAIVLPMRCDGTRRSGPIVLLSTFVVTLHLAAIAILAVLVDFAIEFSKTTGYSWQDQFDGLAAQMGVGISLLFYPHLLSMIVIPALILLKRHITHIPDKKLSSVLFLRRFDGHGDSAAIAALYRAKPRRFSLVFLLAPHGGWRVWDPYLLGLGSMRLPNLWGNTPFFLRSGRSWLADVEKRLRIASAIVIDTTELTEGVRKEIDLIEAHDAWSRTIAIQCVGAQKLAEPPNNHALLGYSVRWFAAKGRLLISVVAAVSTTMIVTTFIRGSTILTILILLALLALYTILFLRPLPDPGFTNSLRRALAEINKAAEPSGKRLWRP